MRTKITIKDFKCFDSKGIDVNISPITFLTGENSSGKSSFTKAILSLHDYVTKTRVLGNPLLARLDLTKFNLGDFNSVINRASKQKTFSFKILRTNKYLDRQVEVEYKFGMKNGNSLATYLKGIKAIDSNGDTLFAYDCKSKSKTTISLVLFKDSYFEFAKSFLRMDTETEYNSSYFKTVFGKSNVARFRERELLEKSCKYRLVFSPLIELVELDKGKAIDALVNRVIDFKKKHPKIELGLDTFIKYLNESDKPLIECLSSYEDKVLESCTVKRTRYPEEHLYYNPFKDFDCECKAIEELEISPDLWCLPIIQILHETYFKKFVMMVIDDMFVQNVLDEPKYVETTNYATKRSNGNTDFFGTLISEYLDAFSTFNVMRDSFMTQFHSGKDFKPKSFVNYWLDKLDIAKTFVLETTGGEYLVRLSDKNGTRPLADEGIGIARLFAILLAIETEIMKSKPTFLVYDDSDGGDYDTVLYGTRTIVLEEPEAHLHPKLQSLLCDIMYDAYSKYNVHFIVETHSEYLIRKSQVIVSRMDYNSNKEADENTPFTTYYFPKGGVPYSLKYRKDGKFVNSFGSGFYDEASNLTFEIL